MFCTCNVNILCVMSFKFPLTTVSDHACPFDHNLIVVHLLLKAVYDQGRFLEAADILTKSSQTHQDAAKAEPSVTRSSVQRVAKRDH